MNQKWSSLKQVTLYVSQLKYSVSQGCQIYGTLFETNIKHRQWVQQLTC